ncbi:Ring finger protein [Chamberlinius hualienensis]
MSEQPSREQQRAFQPRRQQPMQEQLEPQMAPHVAAQQSQEPRREKPIVEKLVGFVEPFLRMPAVFIMDSLITNSSAGPWNLLMDNSASVEISDGSGLSLCPMILKILGFALSCVMLQLPTSQLLLMYRYLLCAGSLIGCYWANTLFLNHQELQENESVLVYDNTNFGAHFFLLSLFSLVYTCTHNGKRTALSQRLLTLALIIPSFLHLNVRQASQFRADVISLVSVALGVFYLVCNGVIVIPECYFLSRNYINLKSNKIREFGLLSVIKDEWERIRAPQVLRIFWILRFIQHYLILRNNVDFIESRVSVEYFLNVSRSLMIGGCDTIVAVVGLASVVSFVAHLSCIAVQYFLTRNYFNESYATVSAFLFLILALQTGLTGLEPDKRFIRLCRNFCLLFTALLHFIHTIVNPVLMSLGASRNRSLKMHSRALTVCGLLLLASITLLICLWKTHVLSTWLFAVTAFAIEVIIKVTLSLLIYLLFMYDAYRNTFWDGLDDCIYYIRATGNTIEFIFGIFLFLNGTWILIYEDGGTLRACLMCIHAYFNIWMQAKAGWKVFVRRRTAVHKINSFPEANFDQLAEFNDVCAICYQEMRSARITVCKHYFHAYCLRKWLYIQDRCPMCHKVLYKIDSDSEGESDGVNEANGNEIIHNNVDSEMRRRVNRLNEEQNDE